MFRQLWKDEDGIVALEYLLVATFVGLTIIVGLSNLANGINAELSELANAILTVDQGYSVEATTGCSAIKDSSGAVDTSGSVSFTTAGSAPDNIDIAACP